MTSIQRFYRLFTSVLFLTSILATTTSFAAKEVLFEGYHKILSGKQHVGYTISRYEIDSESKKFHATIFVKLGALAGNMMESIKAVSDQNLSPISFEYTTLVTENNKASTKNIQASFKVFKFSKKDQALGQKKLDKENKAKLAKGIAVTEKTAPSEILKMTAVVNDSGKTNRIVEDLPKGTFLSYFLVYLMLKSKSGIQTDSKYEYKAIAEEKPKLVDGVAIVRKEEEFNGVKAYKIENKFSDQTFISYVTDKGQVIGVLNPSQSIETLLVAKPSEATGEFNVPTTILKNLFGDVPLGAGNIISARLQAEALKPVTEPAGSKQFGTPAGSGIQNKLPGTEPNTKTQPTVEKIEKHMPGDKPKDK